MSHTWRTDGAPASPTTAAYCWFSTNTATAAVSRRIQATCAGEDVSYTGTLTAPAVQIAKSHSIHSYRVPDITATRSPTPTPAATIPAASAETSAANSLEVTARQAPSTLRANAA